MDETPKATETLACIKAARFSAAMNKSRELYHRALMLAKDWYNEKSAPVALILHTQILCELATFENTPKNRASRWNDALRLLESHMHGSLAPEYVVQYARIAIDRFQDKLSDLQEPEHAAAFRTASNVIDKSIKSLPPSAELSSLLATKSALLRQLAFFQIPASDARRNLIDEAARCAELAVKTQDAPPQRLELAASLWAASRYESSDEKYKRTLELAEAHFRAAAASGFEPARLALPAFYRMTFRPLEACMSYPVTAEGLKNPRRRLESSYVHAEAAVHLWYRQYEPQEVAVQLNNARHLLESALAAGYRNARIVVNLATVYQLLGNTDEARTALTELSDCPGLEWTEALSLVAGKNPSQLLDQGFLLGIDQSPVWNALGTFAISVLDDVRLAELLYKGAVHIDPYNSIALTNFSRLLIQKGDVESVTRARRLLQIAQQFSDRRFTWWRVVLEELESSSENTKSISRVNAKRRPKSIAKTVRSFQKVRQSFRSIEALLNHQERGYQLERLVYAVAELTLDMAAPPYRFRRFHSSYAQVDGYFEHRGAKYRVECKWEDQQTEPTAIEKLAGKIDVAGVSGCFISMSGFMKSAIECARGLLSSKPLILIDGEEIRAVVNKQINFDELLTRKRLHLDKYSDPYHKLNLSAADSA